jgi:hypothetical protein
MVPQIARMAGAVAAHAAREGLLPSVGALMAPQGARSTGAVAAQAAGEGLLPGVGWHIEHNVGFTVAKTRFSNAKTLPCSRPLHRLLRCTSHHLERKPSSFKSHCKGGQERVTLRWDWDRQGSHGWTRVRFSFGHAMLESLRFRFRRGSQFCQHEHGRNTRTRGRTLQRPAACSSCPGSVHSADISSSRCAPSCVIDAGPGHGCGRCTR